MGLLVRSQSGSSDPYALSAGVLSRIPWHSGSGAWGAQVAIEVPTPPTTTDNSTVSSLSALQSALGGSQSSGSGAVSNLRVTLDTSVADPSSVVYVWGSNVDIVIPTGVVGPAFHFKSTPTSNVRVRGSTPGSHSGGRIGQLRGDVSHCIIDGVDINGDSPFTNAETNQAFRLDSGDHIGVYNCRVIAAGYGWLGSNAHVVIVDSNFYAGALKNSELAALGYGADGGVGKWAFRHTGGGPVTFVRSDFRNTMFNTVRLHSTGAAGELFAAIDSRIVAQAEGKTLWTWANSAGDAAILNGCEVWGYAQCGGGEDIRITDAGSRTVDYFAVNDTDFYGEADADYTQAYLDSIASAHTTAGGTNDVDSGNGNTFTDPWPSYPTWNMNSTGDPTSVPLPDGTFSYGEATCVANSGGIGWPDK